MAGNTFGTLFRLTSFGESHGKGIGGIIEGVQPGLVINIDFVQSELNRRRPGQSGITTPREEGDKVEFLSGIFEGRATGAPIAFIIFNNDQRSGDYDNMKHVYRPSHADYSYQAKYGHRDHRGGGRSSARETVARVVAGAIAKMMLSKEGVRIDAYVSRVGKVGLATPYHELNLELSDSNPVRCPHPETANLMIREIEEALEAKNSVGGEVTCVITGVPVGLGEPVFDKLHAVLGHAMLSINAVKGFEYGTGFGAAQMYGSEHNDEFFVEDGKVSTRSNRSGGIQGGISNGEDIYFRVAFKPVATISREQNTVDSDGNKVILKVKGRHDPCVVPRAVPIVEAMAAIVLADAMLINRSYKKEPYIGDLLIC